MSTALYRFYGADETLLYVGISTNVVARMGQHADSQPWWELVARTTVEHFPTREEAREAEQAAIDSGKPSFNKVRAFGKKRMRSFRCPDELWDAAKAQAGREGVTVTTVLTRAIEELVR